MVWSPQLDHVDPRAVQLGSLLVRGLTMLLLVNSACGSPWSTSDLMPWNLFDGKLFHEKYLQAQKGYSVEALVEQNVSFPEAVPAARGSPRSWPGTGRSMLCPHAPPVNGGHRDPGSGSEPDTLPVTQEPESPASITQVPGLGPQMS